MSVESPDQPAPNVHGDETWKGDACSLVDAFRSGQRSPAEELDASLAAIERSDLNAFAFLDDPEHVRRRARDADLSMPFGGVPVGIKQLDPVTGWPDTEASLVFKDRIATYTTRNNELLIDGGGAVPVGLTTASEFGGLNVSVTKINGVTHNPWRHGRSVGGSSVGSSAAVAGGLVTLASGSDGGGSIRIPAGYTGLVGMKGTYGRISRGPHAHFSPGTVVLGCLTRSARDAARFYDVCAGHDPRDPWSLPSPGGWEAGLDSHDLAGLKVAVVPQFGGVTLDPGVEDSLRATAGSFIKATGMVRVDLSIELPNLAAAWMMGNLAGLLATLGDRWPACAGDLTQEIAIGLIMSRGMYNLDLAAKAELQRVELNTAMADAFEKVDLVVTATNPGPAFPAEHTTSNPAPVIDTLMGKAPTRLALRAALGAVRTLAGVAPSLPARLVEEGAKRVPDLTAMGGLTIPANVYGNPSVSIPAGLVDGLPVGMQVMARHHRDALLLDVVRAAEREMPWPLVAGVAG